MRIFVKNLPSIFLFVLIVTACSKSDPAPVVQKPDKKEIELPTLSTTNINQITWKTAASGGNITDNGGADISSRGVCWSTESSPTISDSRTMNGSGEGSFNSSITGLEETTTYYVRAYATNSEGTAYGSQKEFTTTEAPLAVFEGDVILTSQQEIEDFGLQKYGEVTGNVWIQDTNDPPTIDDLSLLEDLQVIGGELKILGNENLNNLDGLKNVTRVGADLTIQENGMLQVINSFQKLESVGGTILISQNLELNTIEGFVSLTSAGELRITANSGNEEIAGFANLMTLSNWLSITGAKSISGFENLNVIGGSVYLINIEELQDLQILGSVTEIGGSLQIFNNSNLENLNGLEGISIINGDFRLSSNFSLIDIRGLANIQSVAGDVTISGNILLNSFFGLDSLRTIGMDFIIEMNDALEGVDSLENLTSIGRNFTISSNPSLLNINGLSSLTEIGAGDPLPSGDLLIRANNGLLDINGLQSLESVYGEVQIQYNENLANLDGLGTLSEVSTGFNIIENTDLDDFCGISDLVITLPSGAVVIFNNMYNPTRNDFIEGDCAL